ncbi:M24 family metallopeptidase [Candidatus Woesearchaeota archaeon]|nr:M24 family metallopeptidase [Candidatus Woesearchaeota archaeon]
MSLETFKSYLLSERIDLAILISPDSNITYFTSLVPTQAILTISKNSAKLHLSLLDKKTKIKDIEIKELSKKLEDNLTSYKAKKIGINKEVLTVKDYEKLNEIFPKASFVDIKSKLSELRSRKSEENLEKITKACRITTTAFNLLIQELTKGNLKTEQEVAFYLEKEIKNRGAELAFPTIVGTGRNSAVPHHITSTAKLQKGFLQLDFGAKWQNYCSDMSRVLYLGKPNKEELKIYQLLLGVQERAIEQVRAEKPYKEIDTKVRKQLGKYAKYFIHGLGHGVGIDIHEAPVYSQDRIQSGQIFTIEPGIYLPNKFGLRIEDTLYFDGIKTTNLTNSATKSLKTIRRP